MMEIIVSNNPHPWDPSMPYRAAAFLLPDVRAAVEVVAYGANETQALAQLRLGLNELGYPQGFTCEVTYDEQVTSTP